MTVFRPALIAAFFLLLSGCVPDGPGRGDVAKDIKARTGQAMAEHPVAGEITLPPGATLENGLTEDEAVAIALWNNAAFQESLVQLDIARGDLQQAGLLPNPVGFYSFGVEDKPLKYSLELPLEAIWTRPFRLRAARAEAERVSHQLSQAGLNLMRDVRTAYGDLLQARAQSVTAEKSMALRRRIADLTQKRLAAGDIAANDANIAEVDANISEQAAIRLAAEMRLGEERLRFAMGIGASEAKLNLDPGPVPACPVRDVEALTREALAHRPDALAADQAVAAAEARGNLSLFGWLGVGAVADATSGRGTGHELSPAVRATLPVLNQNQGGITRADAETERAVRNRETVRHQIRLDVHQANARFRQACDELEVLRSKVKAGAHTNVELTEKAYREGNVPYLLVLEATRAVIDNELRESLLESDLRRIAAEMERSVGHKLDGPMAIERPEKAS